MLSGAGVVEADAVVVGSGPSGAMAALSLLRGGRSVTLLEAGSALPSGVVVKAAGHPLLRSYGGSLEDERGGFVAGGDPETVWFRALQPGGLSNHWTGAVPRCSPQDFDNVDGPIEQSWPISYDDLAPHYERVERVIGTTGTSEHRSNVPSGSVRHRVGLPTGWAQVASAAEAYGHDLLPMPLANGSPWMAARRGTEFNSWSSLKTEAGAHSNLTTVLGARATRLIWDGAQGRVTAVEYHDAGSNTIRRLAAQTVVVAAGAINSIRLLLNSTSADFPDGLGNTHDVLGRYLHDHPRDWWVLETETSLPLPAHPIYMSRRSPAVGPDELPCSWTIGLASPRQRPKAMLGRSGTRFGVQVFGTMPPDPDNRVSITPDSRAETQITMRYDDATGAAMQQARTRFLDVLERGGIAARVATSALPALRPGESVHYGGGVRMHDDPRYGMVDRSCRLHAAPNVHVVDSSVFTTCSEKNPTLTAMAIASHAMESLITDT